MEVLNLFPSRMQMFQPQVYSHPRVRCGLHTQVEQQSGEIYTQGSLRLRHVPKSTKKKIDQFFLDPG